MVRIVIGLAVASGLAAAPAMAQDRRPISAVESMELPAISDPQLSPDGRRVLFVMDAPDWGANRRIGHVHPWAADSQLVFFVAAADRSEAAHARARAGDDVYAFEETTVDQRHLRVVDLAGRTTQITFGSYSVTAYDVGATGRIALTRAASPLLEHRRSTEVWVMDATGGNARRLTTNDVAEGAARLSPDGREVLFTAAADGRFEPYYNDKIFVVPAAGGAARVLLPDAPFQVSDARWSADGRRIHFVANHGVHTQLMEVAPAGGRAVALTSGDHTIGAWRFSPRTGTHVFTLNTPQHPAEVHLLAGGGPPRRVTRVFDRVDRRFHVARQERLQWRGQDGVAVEGLLYYPIGYEPGRRYPLLVFTPGGPAASDTFGFAPEVQVYAGKGYAVLRPNYRGSTGYGDAFLRDMVGGYFTQAHLDVLAGADAAIALGVADPDRLVKKGWSAGGHMTNKLVTFTSRFKAASSGAGAANWISMYAQSDHREFRTPWFGGTPWQADAPIDVYWEHSPLRHVSAVTTPTLFLVGEADPRVPMPQSVEMFRALKSNGVPTRLWVAPREGHGWTELRHVLFRLQVELEWFDKWLNRHEYTWEQPPGASLAAASGTTP
ncbi:MAG: prolyl oligopeptidase family serine peptidase [Vicinamibacterales bacterium]